MAVLAISPLAGSDYDLLVSQVHDAIIGLSLFRIYDGNFRPFIRRPHTEPDRIVPH